ncbi:MAG TPA: FkbM family methyltransferase [Terriglobia bacterium]|nr:FkbM family methyltransferase [Terriglobia bacterium]
MAVSKLALRLYLAAREHLAMAGAQRLPGPVRKTKRTIGLLVERFLLPRNRVSVRVQSGLAQGLWVHARFPEEASYWQGQRETMTEQIILATVHQGSVVFDVGAHIGAVTFGTARLVGEGGRVVAFDADPENVASLKDSCVLNQFEKRVRIVHAAVWSYSTNQGLPFRRGATRRSHGSVIADGHPPLMADGETITVPSTTLDAFTASEGPAPELIKIDVEGGEYEVLRGGEALFSGRRPRILVEVHHAEALAKIGRWIEQFRYSAQWSIPQEGFPRMLFAWPSESPPNP